MSSRGEPKLSRSQKLFAEAREAAELRTYRTHPDVAALAIERVRTRVDALVWTGLVLGLLFTMSNVASFAAQGAAPWSVPWLIAWLLDPMVSLCLVGTLLAESTLAKHQLKAGAWVRVAKWGLLIATYVMNTWASWAAVEPAAIVLHSVPPLVVFTMSEAITDLRDRLTDAVLAAHRYAAARAAWSQTHGTDQAWPQVGTDPAAARTVTAADRTAAPAVGGTAADRLAPDPTPDTTQPGPGHGPARREDRARHVADRTAESTPRGGPDHGPYPKSGDGADQADQAGGPDVSDLLGPGEAVRARLVAAGQRLTRRALITGLREDGHSVSTDRASALLKQLTATEPTEPAEPPAPTKTANATDSGAQNASEAA